MEFGNETFFVYNTPDVSTFYKERKRTRVAKQPQFGGFFAKFVNMSPEVLLWYWYPGNDQEGMPMGKVHPFQAVTTASFDGHVFYFASPASKQGNQEEDIKQWFQVEQGTNVYYYDPFEIGEDDEFDNDYEPFEIGEDEEFDYDYEPLSLDDLDEHQLSLYKIQKRNIEFAEKYYEYTGRNWLSLYPRQRTRHFMWSADYFGQQHSVETRETHFVTPPSHDKLGRVKDDESKPRLLNDYRDPNETLNLTLTVLSCAPRVFEINNFLSDVEIDHILYLATGMKLLRSTTGNNANADESSIRTSQNTWVDREMSPIVDAIYRRAADLLRIDEALLRKRSPKEIPDWPSRHTAAESLQLVHYGVGDEYTAHHDAGSPPVDDPLQPDRFATLLLYLNEGMVGGNTTFPRWHNAETRKELSVIPKRGKAVLFYSYLPDGNLDDLSQHAAAPILKGEKWLTNLWVWDPHFR